MGPFSLSSSLVSPKKLQYFPDKLDWCLLKRKCSVLCQSGDKVVKSSSLSSVLTKQSSVLVKDDHLVLSSNDIAVKDLVPYTGTTSSLVDMDNHSEIGIAKFLRGKNFFVTGATGFLAKVLIEKILRTVPEVGKIFVLIKAKSKEAAMLRLQSEIIDADLFKCLQQTCGKSYQAFMLSKLVPVLGNVCEPNLGLEEHTVEAIAKEVDIIVNSAANTTFDERYDVALDINTRGPSRLMNFAKNCKNLKLFLQVSTAYVNGQRQGRIMEKPLCLGDSIASENIVLDTPYCPLLTLRVEDELKLVLDTKRTFDDNTLPYKLKVLGLERAKKHGWQDTYVFTKAMGEMMIDSMRGDIPVVIIRPSVIESTYKDPFPGWMEGNRMMDPIVLYYGKGQLTGFLVDPNGVLDVVPADMVVNATLAAIAKHGSAGKSESHVYQVASSVTNPLLFQDLADSLYQHFKSMPCMDSLGRPVDIPTMKLFNSMDDFSAHLWGDALQRTGLNGVATSSGKLLRKLESICRKSVEQAKYLANIYQPYTFYEGRFDNSNTKRLMECMSEEERREFGFDVESIDWKDYISNVHIPGLRRYVMKGRGMCN